MRVYRLRSDGSNLIQDRKYHLKSYKQCFVAKDFVDWLVGRGEATNRQDAVDLGKQLVDAEVISHGKCLAETASCILLSLNYLQWFEQWSRDTKMTSFFFSPVVGDHHFKDEFLFFRFKHDEKHKKFRERLRSRTASNSLTASKRSTRSEDDTGSGGSSVGNRGSGSSWGSLGESSQSATPELDE